MRCFFLIFILLLCGKVWSAEVKCLVADFKIAIRVKRMPKTRSGKDLRGTVRKIADNEPYKMPATIDDPVILDEIKADLVENKILKL